MRQRDDAAASSWLQFQLRAAQVCPNDRDPSRTDLQISHSSCCGSEKNNELKNGHWSGSNLGRWTVQASTLDPIVVRVLSRLPFSVQMLPLFCSGFFLSFTLLRVRKSTSSTAERKDRSLAGQSVQKQLQSNNRVSDATFPDKYAHVADDRDFPNRELWDSLLLTFPASARVRPTTIRSKVPPPSHHIWVIVDPGSKHELTRLESLVTVMFITQCRKQSAAKTAIR